MAEIPVRVDNLPVQETLSGVSRPLIVDASGTALVQGPEFNLDGLKNVVAATPGDGQRLAFDEPTQTWIPKRSTSALGIVAFPYEYKTGASPTPNNGNLTVNNAAMNLATVVYVNKLDKDNEDISLFLDNIENGSWLNLYNRVDSAHYVQYDVTGDPTIVGNIYEIPVAFFAEAGPAFTDKLKIELFVRYTGSQTSVPAGGTTGQVLTKLSNLDYDYGWVTP